MKKIKVSKGKLGIERKLKGRGVKFFLFVSPDVPQKNQPKWYDILINGLPQHFDGVHIYYDSSIVVKTKMPKQPEMKIMVIKIFCPIAKFELKPSEASTFYTKLVHNFIDFVFKTLAIHGFRLEGFQFDVVYQMYPPEIPGQFIPIDSIETEPVSFEKLHEKYEKLLKE